MACARLSAHDRHRWMPPFLTTVRTAHTMAFLLYRWAVARLLCHQLTAVHSGEGPITTPWNQYINLTAVADGLIGGDLPIVILYFPVLPSNPKPQNPGRTLLDDGRGASAGWRRSQGAGRMVSVCDG